MGMSKWIKKEWAKTRNRLRSAPTNSDEDHEDDTNNDGNLDREYLRALSQFFERRASPAPAIHKSTSDTNLNIHPKETNVFYKSFNEKTPYHARNEELIAEELTNKKLVDHGESPNSNSSKSSNKPSQNCTNESKSDNNKNTSSSITYDKFWQGNLNSSLDQNSGIKPQELCSSGSSPLNSQKNSDTNNFSDKDQLDAATYKEADLDLLYNNLTKNENYARLNDNKIHQNILFENNGKLETNDLPNRLPKSNTNVLPIPYENTFKDMENNSFEFGTNIDFFNSVPYINFKNLKWTKSSRVSNFGEFCEWRESSWDQIKVVTKRVKSHCGIKSTDLLAPELKILSNIRHPHFLILMGITFDSADNIMPIFEHFRCSLYDHLHNMLGALSLQQTLKISRQICEALLVLHQYGIIHSSVSSHCILLDEDLHTAKLAGFETAFSSKSVQSQHCNHVRHQWYQWLAPEMFESELKSVSPLVDVYSLCLVFWESCLIKIPWNNLSFAQLSDLYNIWKLGVIIPENVFPNQVYNTLTKGLRVDWKQRDLCMSKLLITLKYMEKFYSTKKSIYFYQDSSDKNIDFNRFTDKNIYPNDNSASEDFDNFSESSFSSSSSNASNVPINIPEKSSPIKRSIKSSEHSRSFYFEQKITFVRSDSSRDRKVSRSFPQKDTKCCEVENKIETEKTTPILKDSEIERTEVEEIVISQSETEKQDEEKTKEEKEQDVIQELKNLALKKQTMDAQAMVLKPCLNKKKEPCVIDPITGLRRIPKKTENKLCFSPHHVPQSQNFRLDIKKIIESHETWISNFKEKVVPDGDSNYVINTTIKPASHRNVIISVPEEKPIEWSPGAIKQTPHPPSGKVYANIPTSVRDVVAMKKIVNNDLKSFFEGSLWKQEKIKCLSKMNDGVSDKSALKDIIDGKNDLNTEQNENSTNTEKVTTMEQETQTSFNTENISFVETGDKGNTVEETILFIQKLLLDLLNNIPFQKKISPNKIKTISIDIEHPLFTKPLVYKVSTGNILLTDATDITEKNNYGNTLNGLVVHENLPLNEELINIFNSSTSKTISSDENMQPIELNKTFTVRGSDDSENINDSIEPFTNQINCKTCGAAIQANLNKSQSLPSNNMNDLQAFGTLKRSRSIPHLLDLHSGDDIYMDDDDLSPESLPCHIQLSPAPVNYNYSYYNLSFDKSDKVFLEDELICLVMDEENVSNN